MPSASFIQSYVFLKAFADQASKGLDHSDRMEKTSEEYFQDSSFISGPLSLRSLFNESLISGAIKANGSGFFDLTNQGREILDFIERGRSDLKPVSGAVKAHDFCNERMFQSLSFGSLSVLTSSAEDHNRSARDPDAAS